jgi:hypothetical protein
MDITGLTTAVYGAKYQQLHLLADGLAARRDLPYQAPSTSNLIIRSSLQSCFAT